jgi:hypothetical protein
MSCRISFATYSTAPHLILNLGDSFDRESIKLKIQNASYQGGHTDTVSALDFVSVVVFGRGNSARRGIHGTAVVFTDGVSDEPLEGIQAAAKSLQSRVHRVVVVGLGARAGRSYLSAIAPSASDIFPGTSAGIGVSPEALVALLGSAAPGAHPIPSVTPTTVTRANDGSSASDSTQSIVVPIVLGKRS